MWPRVCVWLGTRSTVHLSMPALQAVWRRTGCPLHVGPEENATLGLLHSLMLVFCCLLFWIKIGELEGVCTAASVCVCRVFPCQYTAGLNRWHACLNRSLAVVEVFAVEGSPAPAIHKTVYLSTLLIWHPSPWCFVCSCCC